MCWRKRKKKHWRGQRTEPYRTVRWYVEEVRGQEAESWAELNRTDKDERNEVVPRRVGQNILLIVCKLRYKVDADDDEDGDVGDGDGDDEVDILRQYLVIAQDAKCQLMGSNGPKWSTQPAQPRPASKT